MNALKNLLGMTALTMMLIVFSSLFLKACDKEYENNRAYIEQYKEELRK
ncbi:hypothetical protein [Moraxella bovoculi]|nr:hypothetical protein [Moraxella bovoculi]